MGSAAANDTLHRWPARESQPVRHVFAASTLTARALAISAAYNLVNLNGCHTQSISALVGQNCSAKHWTELRLNVNAEYTNAVGIQVIRNGRCAQRTAFTTQLFIDY